jgi:hypothetical protein
VTTTKKKPEKLKTSWPKRARKKPQLLFSLSKTWFLSPCSSLLLLELVFERSLESWGGLGRHLGWAKAPCAQTIIHWVTRLSMTKIENASQWVGPQIARDPYCNGFIWMIDTSIGLGSGKILVVLALDAHHHGVNKGAPTLGQVKCIAVAVASSWTGEAIADFLQKVIASAARPLAYLKDGGTDLAKAISVLSERGYPSVCIDDLSHTIANLLKHE